MGISPNTPCAFTRQASDQENFVLSGMTSGSALGVEEDVARELIETSASGDVLILWPWVNQVLYFALALTLSDFVLKTPLTVCPRLPLEIVMQLFKRMGYVPLVSPCAYNAVP